MSRTKNNDSRTPHFILQFLSNPKKKRCDNRRKNLRTYATSLNEKKHFCVFSIIQLNTNVIFGSIKCVLRIIYSKLVIRKITTKMSVVIFKNIYMFSIIFHKKQL